MSTESITTTPAAAAAPGAAARERAVSWAALPVVLAATFMVVLDFFIVNVALPAMQADLAASASAIEWVVAGYGLTCATFLITGGRLGDRYGRRRLFSLSLAAFTLASAVCGLAGSSELLVAGRLAQGMAAAVLSPQVLSIIGVAYTGAHRMRALTAYGVVAGVAAVSGQLIGGVLVDADIAGLGWRSCFLINVPIGVAALLLAPRAVAESREDRPGRLDVLGTVLITLALVDVVLPLVEGRQHGWPAWTWLCLCAAPFALAAFAAWQRRLAARAGAPLLDPAMFRERGFAAGLLTNLLFWCGQASFFLVFALYLQDGRGLDALDAGLVFTILAAAYLVASCAAPGLAPRHGRNVPALGAVLLAAGHGALALAVADVGSAGALDALVPGMVLVGAGMGLVLTPLNSVVLASLHPQRAGAASGALSTVQQVGNAIGVAVAGVLFFGAVDGGFGHAFGLCEVLLMGTSAAVAALTRLLPAGQPAR